MNRNVIISFGLHTLLVIITAMSLPFLAKKPIDLPPIISVELIQITDKTNIPFAPSAKKIIEKVKEKEKKLVSEQAPPKKIKKQKPDAVPLPDEKIEKIKKIKDEKQNPEKVETEIKQISEFEKKELFDSNSIAALITQDQDKQMDFGGLTLSEEDALKAQIFGCWSIPLGLPFNEDLLVRIKLQLKPDGSIIKTEILDHARMNRPGQAFYKVLAESALRAIKLCQPLRVPSTGYERWKNMQLNFDAREMLEG